jgi:hypothetical protein
MSEVENWLHSIGAGSLARFFYEDGFKTLEAVRNMHQSDIDRIVDRNGYIALLNEAIDSLSYGEGAQYFVPAPRAVSFIGNFYFLCLNFVISWDLVGSIF